MTEANGEGSLLVRNVGRLFTGAGDVVERAAVAVKSGRVAWHGPEDDLPVGVLLDGGDEIDAGGALVTPGLVDAHTHPVYGGHRFAEIAMRSAGAGYSEIAAAGGGIAASVQMTRMASFADLEARVTALLAAFLAAGTTTVEAKTGYHLEEDGELEAVRLLHRLGRAERGPSVEVTFLAAHAVGPEFAADPDGYIDAVASWCPAARESGARHADVFCDAGYFSVDQSRRVLEAAGRAGLIPRIHADELARTGGSELAAQLGCSSADHLLRITERDAKALAAGGVVATLAPVTALAMGTSPPVRALQEAGAVIALGSDHNPGTCGTTSMPLVVALAVAELGMSVTDALRAATAGGAASLRLPDRGVVASGMRGDLVVWQADHEGAFAWTYGLQPSHVVVDGRRVA